MSMTIFRYRDRKYYIRGQHSEGYIGVPDIVHFIRQGIDLEVMDYDSMDIITGRVLLDGLMREVLPTLSVDNLRHLITVHGTFGAFLLGRRE